MERTFEGPCGSALFTSQAFLLNRAVEDLDKNEIFNLVSALQMEKYDIHSKHSCQGVSTKSKAIFRKLACMY